MSNIQVEDKIEKEELSLGEHNDLVKQLRQELKQRDVALEEAQAKISALEHAKQTSDDKLQERLADIRVLNGQVDTLVRHLSSVIFDGLWKKEHGMIDDDLLIQWGTLTVGAGVKLDIIFPIRLRLLPELALGWTLSMCTLDDMKRYYGTSFGQLFCRLALVLPIHTVHETALPIIEAMLHHIKDSTFEDLLRLDNLLMTCWADPRLVRSDDRDLCDCRMLELIIRTADHHGRQWARLKDVEKQWRQQRLSPSPHQEPLLVVAYRKWITDIMVWAEGQDVLIYSMPQLLSEDVSERVLAWMRLTARPGYERTKERVKQNEPSSPRMLLAGQLFESIRVYALVDLAKQEVMLFRVPGAHFAIGRRILTLPQRFGHHNDLTATSGYTTDNGGNFEIPKPFILGELFFVADHMPDVFDANNLQV